MASTELRWTNVGRTPGGIARGHRPIPRHEVMGAHDRRLIRARPRALKSPVVILLVSELGRVDQIHSCADEWQG